MLMRLLYAVAVGVVTWLACQLIALVLGGLVIGWVVAVGGFIGTYAALISLVAAIFAFVSGEAVVARWTPRG